jgi:hypothetical protein
MIVPEGARYLQGFSSLRFAVPRAWKLYEVGFHIQSKAIRGQVR